MFFKLNYNENLFIKLLLSFCFILVCNHAMANGIQEIIKGEIKGGRCSQLFAQSGSTMSSQTHPKFEIIENHSKLPLPKMHAAITTILNKLADMVQGKLEIPEGLKIIVEEAGDKAYYQPGVLHIPYEFLSLKYHKHLENTVAVLAHEWGHFLSEHNLMKLFPELKAAKENNKENFTGIFMSYSELFSDVVSVLYLRDGRANRDATFCACQSEYNGDNFSARLRDFTERHDEKGWEFQGPYAMMGPMRTWLWKHYLNRPVSQRLSGDVLHMMILAVGEQIKVRLENPDVDWSPEKINRELMRGFQEKMDSLGGVWVGFGDNWDAP